TVRAVVTRVEDVPDLVALGQPLALDQVVDGVDHLDVVRGAGDHDVRVGQQVRRPGQRAGEHLVALDVVQKCGDLRRAEQFVHREHVVLDGGVRGDRVLRVVPVVLQDKLDLAAAHAAGG